MKQFLLFVSLSGAALYALLVFAHHAVRTVSRNVSSFLKLNPIIQSPSSA